MHLTHDAAIDIATGRHRRETNWKNKSITWSALLAKLSTTHRTAETYSEYKAAKKTRQSEIKDIGGFVGGYLTGGRRKPGNVLHRQLITLDLDYAKPGMWDDFILLFHCAACVYSTHAHSSEAPRLRLIIPLDREVMADEYIAIGRRIAGKIGIEDFDNTGFQPSRLMYWPSTSADGEYIFEYQDGPWLSADAILGTYHNWRDSSEWPVSERVSAKLQTEIKKQGDPLEKPGIVGAFCRTYTISEAIEAYLSDVYEAAGEDRYTYAEGSTAGGLVVYEDKYAYSHHGTDPASEKLCNAFDLVRLHKYGLKDEDAREGTPINKLPSYTAMQELAMADARVKRLRGQERIAEARADFATEEPGTEVELVEVESDEWLGELEVDRKGNYFSTINNVKLILENDPRLKKRFALDQFENREVALKDLPWRKVTHATRYLTDADASGLWHYLEKTYGINNMGKTEAALSLVMRENGFHPVRRYLEALQWDGEERVDTLLVEYLGAEDTDYVRAVTRKMLVAAVARVFNPGVKFDYCLVLVGGQGQGKSQILDRLGRQWFSDSFTTVQGKEAFEQIQGVWLIEMAELAGLKKAEVDTIKHFISKREDRYRVAYGRRTENFPRQCVFFGTSNNKDFLRDPTGNRRFWPVDTMQRLFTKDVFAELTEDEVGQIWAEAVELYRCGEKLYLSPELEAEAQRVQAEHSEQDERVGMIEKYLDTLLPDNWEEMDTYARRAWLAGDELQPVGTVQRERVCMAEIWCEVLGGKQQDMNRYNTKELHDIMRRLSGWKDAGRVMRFNKYGTQRGYVRAAESVTRKKFSADFVNTN
jgi:predicted P-loop ATPase